MDINYDELFGLESENTEEVAETPAEESTEVDETVETEETAGEKESEVAEQTVEQTKEERAAHAAARRKAVSSSGKPSTQSVKMTQCAVPTETAVAGNVFSPTVTVNASGGQGSTAGTSSGTKEARPMSTPTESSPSGTL